MPVRKRKTITIGAENKFTDYIPVPLGQEGALIVTGTWTATVTLQSRHTDENGRREVNDLDTTTVNGTFTFPGTGDEFRVGVKTGDYGSGDPKVTIQG